MFHKEFQSIWMHTEIWNYIFHDKTKVLKTIILKDLHEHNVFSVKDYFFSFH